MMSKSRTETACKANKMLLQNNSISPYSVSLRIQSQCGEILTRKTSVFGYFLRSEEVSDIIILNTKILLRYE